MTKQEFLKLFELEKIYTKYENHIPFCLSYRDSLTETKNFILFFQDEENKFHLVVECTAFNKEPQKLELNLILSDNLIAFNEKEPFVNELFPFLTFDTNFEAALKFVADFINKILIPKYELKGHVSVY